MRWSLWLAAMLAAGVVAAAAQASTSPSGTSTTGPSTTYRPYYAQEIRFSAYNETAVTADWDPGAAACNGSTALEVRAEDEQGWRRLPPESPVRIDGLRPATFYQVRLGVGCAGVEPMYGCFRTPPGFEWCRTQHPTTSPRTQTSSLPPGVARIANATLHGRGEHDATFSWQLDALGCSSEASILELYLVHSPAGVFYPPVYATHTYLPGLGRQQAAVDGLVSAGAYLARFDFHGTCPGQAQARLGDYCFQTRPAPMACTDAQWRGAGNFTLGTLPPSRSSSAPSRALEGTGATGGTGAGGADGTGTAALNSGNAELDPTTAASPATETGASVGAAAAGIAVLAALLGSAWAVRRRLP